VQQALVQSFPQWDAPLLTISALIVASLLAVLSWHLVEQRALALKPSRPSSAADRKAERHGIAP
jgi:peptidoglycan/LPS O-acetylase OafA/YrhL